MSVEDRCKHESMALAAIGALTTVGHLLPVEVEADDIQRGIHKLATERDELRREVDTRRQRNIADAREAERHSAEMADLRRLYERALDSRSAATARAERLECERDKLQAQVTESNGRMTLIGMVGVDPYHALLEVNDEQARELEAAKTSTKQLESTLADEQQLVSDLKQLAESWKTCTKQLADALRGMLDLVKYIDHHNSSRYTLCAEARAADIALINAPKLIEPWPDDMREMAKRAVEARDKPMPPNWRELLAEHICDESPNNPLATGFDIEADVLKSVRTAAETSASESARLTEMRRVDPVSMSEPVGPATPPAQREPTAAEADALTKAHRASVRRVATAFPTDPEDEALEERAPCSECERLRARVKELDNLVMSATEADTPEPENDKPVCPKCERQRGVLEKVRGLIGSMTTATAFRLHMEVPAMIDAALTPDRVSECRHGTEGAAADPSICSACASSGGLEVTGQRSLEKKRCPDDGTCHHNCGDKCWRVKNCGPLSGVYPGDDWPEDIRREHDPIPRPLGRLNMEGHKALFFDTHQVVGMIRDYLERNGYAFEDHKPWAVMLTVQGAVVTGVTEPEDAP